MSWLALVLAAVFLVLSLVPLIPSPHLAFWKLKLGVIELGHWLAVPAFLIGLVGLFTVSAGGGIACLLALFATWWLLSSQIGSARLEGRSFFRGLPRAFFFRSDWSVIPEVLWIADGEGDLVLDFYRPVAAPNGVCVVAIHGGGWEGGNRREMPEIYWRLARSGFAVAALTYRLAPLAAWPAQRSDISRGLAFLRREADALGIDAERLVMFGRSAGGQLAAVAATTEPGIAGCISLYTPFDLPYAYEHSRDEDLLGSRRLVRTFMGGTPEEVPENYLSASPGLSLEGQAPPFLLIHGVKDELVSIEQSRRFVVRLQSAGIAHLYVELPWATHAFDFFLNGPSGKIAWREISRFLAPFASIRSSG